MTLKEEAKGIVQKFLYKIGVPYPKGGVCYTEREYKAAAQCAIIHVEGIIEANPVIRKTIRADEEGNLFSYQTCNKQHYQNLLKAIKEI